MSVFVTFGEIMARMAPTGVMRLQQVLPGTLEVTFAGAEANVAASLAMLGSQARFVTAMPDNFLSDACIADLRGLGVDTTCIRRLERGRFGIYFVETGANQRPSRVTYDRESSSISLAHPDDFDWDAVFRDAHWLHLTGITSALSLSAAETTLEAARQAKAHGVRVSLDPNFRAKLWRWDSTLTPLELASRTLRQLMPYVDLLMANADDCRLLGIDTSYRGNVPPSDQEYLPELARRAISQYSNISRVTATLRENISASHNNWGAMLFDGATNTAFFAPLRNGSYQPWEIRNIVDRVGGGDAYAAGLLFALHHPDYSNLQTALEFATAASCLAHSVVGDFNFASRAEIDELMGGSGSGRVVR
ncbi:MAG: PfkB family carbohydrate kinase [Planctomyces sp.]